MTVKRMSVISANSRSLPGAATEVQMKVKITSVISANSRSLSDASTDVQMKVKRMSIISANSRPLPGAAANAYQPALQQSLLRQTVENCVTVCQSLHAIFLKTKVQNVLSLSLIHI